LVLKNKNAILIIDFLFIKNKLRFVSIMKKIKNKKSFFEYYLQMKVQTIKLSISFEILYETIENCSLTFTFHQSISLTKMNNHFIYF
jgi:hypothetical protein